MINTKKAGVQWPLVALFFLVAVALLVTHSAVNTIPNNLGENQYTILSKIEEAVALEDYISLSATYSGRLTRLAFLQNSGIMQSAPSTSVTSSRCGLYLYPNYNSKTDTCIPRYEETIKQYFQHYLYSYLQSYTQSSLVFLYDLNLYQKNNQELVLQSSGEDLSLPFFKNTSSSSTAPLTCSKLTTIQKTYPKTALGYYGKEQPIICATGECFSQVTQLLYETYQLQNKHYPYVVGGESPYCPQHVQEQADLPTQNFFSGITLSEERLAMRSVLAPGFDSSGWAWWVGKHASIPFFEERLGATQYYEQAIPSLLCSEDSCTLASILEQVQPGDILFVRESERLAEDGSTILSGAIHLLIVIELDETTGRLIVLYADPLKGLIKEFLPERFASGEHSLITGLFRPTYQSSGEEQLPEDVQLIPPFVGPFEWCRHIESDQPSNTYLKQLQAQPFQSTHHSYFDLFIATALQEGIDPALLATHAVLESSMGKNDACTSKQKSSLTGCGWYPSCSSGCECQNDFVRTDETQMVCTAETDLRAYEAARTGIAAGSGLYHECVSYKDSPEIFWNCIFCIYQGNYDGIIDGGKYYFTRDKTCDYAEKAKKEYCTWRAYFDKEWDDLSMLQSLATTSELTFSPSFLSTTQLNLPAMNLITNEFIPALLSCTDNLETCVQTKLQSFNLFYDQEVIIKRMGDNQIFANTLTESMLDCRYNAQKNCICPLRPTYLGLGTEKQIINLSSNGELFADNQLTYTFSFNPSFLAAAPTKFDTLTQIISEAGKNATFQVFDLQNISSDGTPQPLTNQWNLITPYQETYTQPGLDVLGFGLFKQSYSSLAWIPYTQNMTHLTCRDNKHYFSFQATILSTNDKINFSLYLEDTTPEELTAVQSVETGACFEIPSLLTPIDTTSFIEESLSGNSLPDALSFLEGDFTILGYAPYVIISWQANKPRYNYHSFILEIASDPQFNQVLGSREIVSATALALPEDTSPPILEQLTYTATSQSTTFKYKLNTVGFSGQPLQENKQYYYRITPVDHYLQNGTRLPVQSFNFTDELLDNLPLTPEQAQLLSAGSSLIASGLQDALCIYNHNWLLKTEDFLPAREGNLVVYPLENIFNKSDALYHIEDIPRITCDETDTQVGKICAGNKRLVERLYDVSDGLLANNWEMIITQAYRNWDIQYRLFERSGFDTSMACNPGDKTDPNPCPHMIAGAIDLVIIDATTKTPLPKIEQENFMCRYDFIRYGKEWWHFEIGTPKWAKAEVARETGDCCYYGTRHPDDVREATCSI